MLTQQPLAGLAEAAPAAEPVGLPRVRWLARLASPRALHAWVSGWLLLNHPLLWRVRPSSLLLVAVLGHQLAGWVAQQLPASVLWDGDLKFHLFPLAYAWALAVAVGVLGTRRLLMYRDAGQHLRQRLATVALSLAVVVALALPADHFQQAIMQRQVESFTADDALLVRRLSALQDSLFNTEGTSDAPACAGWPADWDAASTLARFNDLLDRNDLDASLDEPTLAAAIAGQHVSCGGADTSTMQARAYDFKHLSLQQPLLYAGVRDQLDAQDWLSIAANHVVAIVLVPLFWLVLALMSQPRRPPERRWLRRLFASARDLARWPRMPLLCRIEDRLLRSHPAWWALWPLRILLLSSLICGVAAGLIAVYSALRSSYLALLFGGLLYLFLGMAMAWRCNEVPLRIGGLRHPQVYAILVLTLLLPLLPFEALVLWLGATKGGSAMLTIVLDFVSPHLLVGCLLVNVVRVRVAVVVSLLGVLLAWVVAVSAKLPGPYLAGWLLACAGLALPAAVPHRTGRKAGRTLVALVLCLAPAALVAANMLAKAAGLTTGYDHHDLWILLAWWVLLWIGPAQGLRRVMAAPAAK
jgi:hypothetical protein